MSEEDVSTRAGLILSRVWEELQETAFVRRAIGEPIHCLPDVGEAAAIARSGRARDILLDIDALDGSLLPRELAMTVKVARFIAARMEREGEWYWLAFDPSGAGFFALFAPTAYCAGFFINTIHGMLAQHVFEHGADLHRYIDLIEDYAKIIGQLRERTEGQAARGIRMPVALLDQSIALVGRLAEGASAALTPSDERLAPVGGAAARERIAARITASVSPAFEALLEAVSDPAYRAEAPTDVGMAQFPGGSEIYAELIKMHTTLDLTPQQIHDRGVSNIARIRSEMSQVVADAGLTLSPRQYLGSIEREPKWRASDVAGVEAVFRRYIDRIEPHIDEQFNFKPKAGHDVAPLPAILSGSMTFGYYDLPSQRQPTGRYLFNGENLTRNALFNVAALNYHELVPGHHLHLASQRENETLHPVRAHAFLNAFNEGWAEYAATLAGEMGMYEEPEERFGRLVMDSFLTCRLLVDTGMNALGWSLDEARDYMRENAFMPETEVCSESIRYSCDIPAQSLAYKLGEYYLVACREEMRSALGERFDIRAFHDTVLRPGGLPLPLVGENVTTAIAKLAVVA